MSALVRRVGYAALVGTPLALLGASLLTPPRVTLGAVTLNGGVLVAGGFAAAMERERVFERLDVSTLDGDDVVDALAVVLGALLTYVLSVASGLGPVLGSALVGLSVGVVVPRVAVPAYCGSFVGMASPSVFSATAYLAVAGIAAGLAYVASNGVFGGFGGKLGTVALFGCATAMLLPGVEYVAGSPLPWSTASAVVPVALVGAVATVVLSVRLELGGVLGSALVGVVAGVVFPALLPRWGATLAAVAFCASFVGMSTVDRLSTPLQVGAAGTLSGLLFIGVSPAFAGAGGKLGTIAFVSCVALFGATKLLDAAVSLGSSP
ncbi:MAG: hypothetical protein ACQETI_04850 [Halobacteriota archaeon]